MVGLINAIGTSQSSRVQSEHRDAERTDQQQRSKLLPLLTGVRAAERVLRDTVEAVQTLDSPESELTRPTPSHEQSDRFEQADQEQRATATSGRQLDVKA